uniref:Uncharacterized protein n=1 Tax=Arcella intermedia TaxID=1963864 RepID=A0A6B2LAW1_9EUKA
MTTSKMTTYTSFDSQHQDIIHDAQMDYYGKRVATCSSDRSIKVFDITLNKNAPTKIAELLGHEGPVWQVSWAHPKYGSFLASCSYDRRVIIWQEERPYSNVWKIVLDYAVHELSVNSIAWAPPELGLKLACASSDGYISILTKEQDSDWQKTKFMAHNLGVNAISWAPASASTSLLGGNDQPVQKLVSGGCDNLIKIWEFTQNEWQPTVLENVHKDWIRDVAWAPNVGLPYSTIASCSQDGSVIIWNKTDQTAWVPTTLEANPNTVVWRVSWSITGNILAVSSGDNSVTLWKQTNEKWEKISTIDDNEQKQQ